MKSIKKLLFVMAALAAVFGFVACSDDDDDPSTVAVYTGKDGDNLSYVITFYDNGTFKNVLTIKGVGSGTVATGTYKGDVTKDTSADNEVTFTIKTMGGYDTEAKKFTEASIREYVKMMLEELSEVFGIEEVTDTVVNEFIEEHFTDVPMPIENGSFEYEDVTYTIKN